MQLFAILAAADESSVHGRENVRFFLNGLLSNEHAEEYLAVYDAFLERYKPREDLEVRRKKVSVSSVRVLVICEEINRELAHRQKMVVLFRLLDFMWTGGTITDLEMEFLETVYSALNIEEHEYHCGIAFVTEKDLQGDPNYLTINNSSSPESGELHICREGVQGTIRILRIPSANLFIARYSGTGEVQLNGVAINDGRIHVLSPGSAFRSSLFHPIYYSDVLSAFLKEEKKDTISFRVEQLTYRFRDGSIGIHEISFSEDSGKLIGIMGGSGAGKSTLLNILNGIAEPADGRVLINGIDLHAEQDQLKGVVGFVSQDDLLMEELTVFENLFLNAKLCFSQQPDNEIREKTFNMLQELGLFEVKDLVVGSPLNKMISGGQRKRLNIALELIREPLVLFVDEPTSGLSSRDSEIIIDLLKQLSLKGRLVFVVIHQPSSEIFKAFDKLIVLDKGGYLAYIGDPVDSINYFKLRVNHITAQSGECLVCGNVNPEQVFSIIETRVLDDYGNPTNKRKISPRQWHTFFKESGMMSLPSASRQEKPRKQYSPPGRRKQLMVFLKRDVTGKFRNRQYLLLTLLEAPLLAFVLAFLTRYTPEAGSYSYAMNKNVPAFFFMSVIVALFLGLIISAEELFRDRKIRKREQFLNLSNGAYLFSKLGILMTISAVQMALFVIPASFIIGLQSGVFVFWLVLFSTAVFANVLGLIISASFTSAVTIYITIPFLVIPQLLLSGVLVNYGDLHPAMAQRSRVPLIGEVMTARWAYEAIAVSQFRDNPYQQLIYKQDHALQHFSFYKSGWISGLRELYAQTRDETKRALFIQEALVRAGAWLGKDLPQPALKDSLAFESWLSEIKSRSVAGFNAAEQERNVLFGTGGPLNSQPFSESLRLRFNNQKLQEQVMQDDPLSPSFFIERGKVYPSRGNIYFSAWPDQGIRTHLYAPQKRVLGNLINTVWCNVAVIWIGSILLFLVLYFEGTRRIALAWKRWQAAKKRKVAGSP